MTVAALITVLSQLDQESLVVMSSDAAGNQYSPLSQVDAGRYIAESTYSGFLLDEEEEDDDTLAESVPCVALWPTD